MSELIKVQLPFGRTSLVTQVPARNLIGIFSPKPTRVHGDGTYKVRTALRSPIDSAPLHQLVRSGQRVVVITSDLTRPCPSSRLLPLILDELSAAGVSDSQVTVVAALGLHRAMSRAELEVMVGSAVCGRVRVINQDPTDVVPLGVTAAGTPVEIFRPVVEADSRVCLGNLEFHYFAGYSGGAKAIVPGCASRATVTANHAHMVEHAAAAGALDGNPVRSDLEEAAAMVAVDFVLNVLVDGQHQIVGAVAGDINAAHRAGCRMVAERCSVTLPRPADVVLVSAGGWPKDVNLYQAHKALEHAVHAVRPGGIIVLAAECAEGIGQAAFEEWMTAGENAEVLIRRIQQRFVLGGHKAAAIAKLLRKARIFLVSPRLANVPLTGLELFATLDEALHAAFDLLGDAAQVAVLPEGGSSLPQVA